MHTVLKLLKTGQYYSAEEESDEEIIALAFSWTKKQERQS